MVTSLDDPSKVDEIVRHLGDQDRHSESLVRWVESRQACQFMRRRATWCTVSAWAFLSGAAIVSSVVAITMSNRVRGIFSDQVTGDEFSLMTIAWTPWILSVIAALVAIGGFAALVSGWMPGYRSTRSAIDLSLVCEAVTGLLSVGVPYPDAFRAAAKIAPRGEAQHWLIGAATRVESGQSPGVTASLGPESSLPASKAMSFSGDVAMLELLIASADDHPAGQWSIASHHFRDVAGRRLSLLTQSLPLITTLLAGLLLWVSISSTLGWMWKSVGNIVNNDFGF